MLARILAAILLALLAVPAAAGQDEVLRLERSGQILPLETLLERARARHPGKVLDVELEHEHGRYVYEVILLDQAGRVWEVEMDAATGELLEPPPEDD